VATDEVSKQNEWSAITAHAFVQDMARATRFYERIGFSIAFLYGDPPFYGEVYKDKLRLSLRLVCEPVFVDDVRSRKELLSATIVLPSTLSLDRHYESCVKAGIPFHRHLANQQWGTKEFVIADPDDNLICFSALS
jgi:uncharacterized glyoxalase superfamily protein PhnB